MTALKKINPLNINEFINNYEGTGCQFHEGEVWEAQATTPDHSYIQGAIREFLGTHFNKNGGPRGPGGWWIFTEVAVRYTDSSLFSHDLAGWKRSRFPARPRRFPISERPDWVCEILSSNSGRDLIIKKQILFENEVPFYWIVDPEKYVLSVFEWHAKSYFSILELDLNFNGKIPPFEAIDIKLNVLFGEEDE